MQASQAARTQLDDACSRSIGMRRVLATARRAAADAHTVWISGEPGVGKTWLAHAIADLRKAGKRTEGALTELDGQRTSAAALAQAIHDSKGGILILTHATGLFATDPHVLKEGAAIQHARAESERTQILMTSLDPIRASSHAADITETLAPVEIEIPPLRERTADLPELIAYLTRKYARGRSIRFTPRALSQIERHSWPGNVTELALALRDTLRRNSEPTIDHIELVDGTLQHTLATKTDDPVMTAMRALVQTGTRLDRVELAYVRATLEHVDGNKTRAAAVLGIDRKTLYRKLANDEILRASEH